MTETPGPDRAPRAAEEVPEDNPGHSEIWVKILQEKPGSDTVWSALHERYRRRILVYAHYRLGPDLRRTCDPEDVVNEAWGRIVKHWEKFEYRGADSLFHWLCLQVHRVVLDRRRKMDRAAGDASGQKKSGIPADELDVTNPGAGPRTQVMQEELRDKLAKTLDSVPELYRRVLIPVCLEGRTPNEVAEELDMKPDTVRKQVKRGLEHWRNALGGDPMRHL